MGDILDDFRNKRKLFFFVRKLGPTMIITAKFVLLLICLFSVSGLQFNVPVLKISSTSRLFAKRAEVIKVIKAGMALPLATACCIAPTAAR